MKMGFDLGRLVRIGKGSKVGELVDGKAKIQGDKMPHYAREGFYYVKFKHLPVQVFSEEDLTLVGKQHDGRCPDCASEDLLILNYQVSNANTSLEVIRNTKGEAIGVDFNRIDGESGAEVCMCVTCKAEFSLEELLKE